jgi:hypothetical protein
MDISKDPSRSHVEEDELRYPPPTCAAPLAPPTDVNALLMLVDRWMAEPDIDDEVDDDLETALNENRRQSGDLRMLFPE